MQISDKYLLPWKQNRGSWRRSLPRGPRSSRAGLLWPLAGSPRAQSRVAVDQTASLRRQAQTPSCTLSRSFRLVLRCGRLSQKGVKREWVVRLCGEMILVFISSSDFSPSWDPTAQVIPMRLSSQRRWPQVVARLPLVPKLGQNREVERKPGKKEAGASNGTTLVQTRRRTWRSGAGSPGRGPGLRPPGGAGTPGACAVRPQPRPQLP